MLQFPREISAPLDADHSRLAKYKDRSDPNYINVRNTLRYLTIQATSDGTALSPHYTSSNFMQPVSTSPGQSPIQPSPKADHDRAITIQDVLGVRDSPGDDLNFVKSRMRDGSYRWLTQTSLFRTWVTSRTTSGPPPIFWLFGLPATGKTSLASVAIDYLLSTYEHVQFHFFSRGHQTKKTAAYGLRSIAAQLAQQHQGFRDQLNRFHEDTGIHFTSQDQSFSTIWEKIYEGIIFKYDFGRPLVWVFDGIDEAEQQTLFLKSLTTINSTNSIRIFLSSRPTKVPGVSASSSSQITPFFLSTDDTKTDIRDYVSEYISRSVPADDTTQQNLIEQVVMKASGSFLWVRLALENLEENWHTQEDILTSLTNIPTGMIQLYEKMLLRVTSQATKVQSMARRILTWVSCSWRPLRIAELQTALEPEFRDFVKFEDTIQQICGHFVSVNAGRVSLIHATAQQFLTEDRDASPAYIHMREAHTHIALCCLRYLSKDHWRRVFQPFSNSNHRASSKALTTNKLLLAEQGHPLLGYATCYWAYHASKASVSSHELFETIKQFLVRYSLSWIEAIALSANLRYLTRAAKYMKAYAKLRGKRSLTIETLSSLKVSEEDDPKLIQKWSTDFIRIVGKFGPSLLSSPGSVYRDVPPFCPSGSMIGRTFGEAKSDQLSVAGLPSEGWDDRIACVSVGEDETATTVLAIDAWFITLTSGGKIAIWHTETFERARVIDVGEWVSVVSINKAGSLLATGTTSKYNVWELASGRSILQIDKTIEARPMAMAFENDDSKLLVGSDDCSIFTYNIGSGRCIRRCYFTPTSSDYDGCPKVMQLSPDLTEVAMAWRGKPPIVWQFAISSYLAVKKCRTRQSTDSIAAPEALCWQPDGASLFVLCHDSNLVEWKLYDDQQLPFPQVQARKIGISRDGNFLFSHDHVGTISVWTFPKLSLVYKLVSENDFIRGLTFSPDSQRIYDTRGSMCNIWEPDALVRPEEHELDDHSSLGDISFASSEPAVSYLDNKESPVTVLATSSDEEHFCCGRENGVVNIHSIIDGKKLRRVYAHASTSSVLTLSWSNSGRFVTSGDDAARFIAKRLEKKEKDKWAVFPVLDTHLSEPVQQFLYSADERLLLVATLTWDRIYDLKSKQEIHALPARLRGHRHWLQHPSESGLAVCVDAKQVVYHSWRDLQERSTAPVVTYEIGDATNGSASGSDELVWASYSTPSNDLLYGTLPNMEHYNTAACLSHSGLHLESIPASKSTIPSVSITSAIIKPDCMPELASRVKRMLGVSKGCIVYLDHDNWLCTWEIDSRSRGFQRHFFLPKDWVSANYLQMANLNRHGTLLCPRGGYIAVVRNGIRA